MRCCLETLSEEIARRGNHVTNYTQGETLDCKYQEPGNEEMIFDHGVWRWNREKHFPE